MSALRNIAKMLVRLAHAAIKTPRPEWDGDPRIDRSIRRVQLVWLDGEPALGTSEIIDHVCGVLDRGAVTPRDHANLLEVLERAPKRERRHVLRVLKLRGRTTHAELVEHLKGTTDREAADKLARELA